MGGKLITVELSGCVPLNFEVGPNCFGIGHSVLLVI